MGLDCQMFWCIPTVLFERECTKEGPAVQNVNDIHSSYLTIPTTTRNHVKYELKETNTSVKHNRIGKNPLEWTKPSDKCKEFEVNCTADFRQQLETEWLSGRSMLRCVPHMLSCPTWLVLCVFLCLTCLVPWVLSCPICSCALRASFPTCFLASPVSCVRFSLVSTASCCT